MTNDEAIKIYSFIKNELQGKQEFQTDVYYCPQSMNVKEYMEKKCIRIRTQKDK